MKKMKKGFLWLLLACSVGLPIPQALAQGTTSIRVRVVSHDAKIIGSGVGGAQVYVRDAASGKVLAEGIQEGGTGSTQAIVVDPVARGAPIYDTPEAAVFTAEVALESPTVLEFIAEGPLGYDQAIQRATKTMLVLPGEDILGDGIVLELHGFIVELIEPSGDIATSAELSVTAQVRMMCGCPLEPGGLWNADRVRVTARVYHDGQLERQASLTYAGRPNMFSGTLSLVDVPSGSQLVVLASDSSRANFGSSAPRTIK